VDFTCKVPFRLTGKIDQLNYELGPEQLSEPDKEAAAEVIARAKDQVLAQKKEPAGDQS
jgi:hypothetical protein